MKFNDKIFDLQTIIKATGFNDIGNVVRGVPNKIWASIDEGNKFAVDHNLNLDETLGYIYFTVLKNCNVLINGHVSIEFNMEGGLIKVDFDEEHTQSLVYFDNIEKEFNTKKEFMDEFINGLIYDSDLINSKINLTLSMIQYRCDENIKIESNAGKKYLYDKLEEFFDKNYHNILNAVWMCYESFYDK